MNYNQLFFVFIFIILFPICAFAQQPPLPTDEQIQHHVNNVLDDSVKVVILTDACFAFLRSAPNKVAQYADQGLQILDQRPNLLMGLPPRLQFLTIKMYAERSLGNYKAAKIYAKQVIDLAEKYNQESTLGEAYSNLAILYSDQEEYDSTIIYDLLSLKIREKNNSIKVGRSYNNVGFDYKQNGQYQKALSYYYKAIAYKKARDIENTLGNTYFNIANVHQLLTNYDSAYYYYEEALILAKEEGDNLFVGEILHYKGIIHSKKEEQELAKDYFLKAIELFQQPNSNENLIITDTYQELAKTYLSLNELGKAESLLDSAQKILLQNNRTISSAMIKNHKVFELLYWKKRDFVKAREHLNKSFVLKDSLHKRTLDQKVYKLLTDYDDELKQQRIATLEQEQKISDLEHQRKNRQTLFLFCIVLLMLFILIILYRINKWRSKVNKELETLNNTKDKLFSIIAHDLKNPLSAFRSITQSLSDDFLSISKEDLEYFIKQLNNSANSLFELLQNLLYWSISESGLLEFQPQKIPINSNTQEVVELLRSSATIKSIKIANQVSSEHIAIADKKMLHTILRNLIANAIKFTPNNGQITIQTTATSKELTISIKDTGIGMAQPVIDSLFKLEATTSKRNEIEGKGTGLGLVLCKELVERQNGKIWVESSPNQGSTFNFTLPNS